MTLPARSRPSATAAVSTSVVQFPPTRRLVVPVHQAPDGEGSETYDHWEMRIHKRLLEMDISTAKDQTALRSVTKIPIPDTVSRDSRETSTEPVDVCCARTGNLNTGSVASLAVPHRQNSTPRTS